jgi:predicted ArsR family transcriptional regulator
MSKLKTYTVAEAAAELGLAVITVRRKIKSANLAPVGIRKTGTRGRPANIYAASAIRALKG